MNKNFYFDGKQIKNYLIGFASLFAEIPYKDRSDEIQTVPIHYGSPSDVVSYLENDVDNDATTNRNRLKDISVPMFSFRLTGLEHNTEKRRAPHDTIAVDLRPLGYNTGYVTMFPAPYKFTMELVCWAASDYQAFEITEQIIPYFNSPQQVIIEPLPRSRVSTTEIFMDSVELETDPESQKYSATITMSFSLTGYILTQPKIWSTNLQFELSLLDGTKNSSVNIDETDYSVGHEIRDLNVEPKTVISNVDRFKDLDSFIKDDALLVSEYGAKMDWYNTLVENNRIDGNGDIIDTTEFAIDYKGTEKIFYPETIKYVADEIEDVRYLMQNEKYGELLKSYSLEANFKLLNDMFLDDTKTIEIYLKLLDNNLATKGFNTINTDMMNSEKMALFGSIRIDIADALSRMRNYLSGLQTMKMNIPKLQSRFGEVCNQSIFYFANTISHTLLPSEIQLIIEDSYILDNEGLTPLDIDMKFDYDGNIDITTESNISGKLIVETNNGISITDFTTDDTGLIKIESSTFNLNETFGLVLKVEDRKTTIYGIVAVDLTVEIDVTAFDYRVFGLDDSFNIGLNSDGIEVPFEMDNNFHTLFDCRDLMSLKFMDMDVYIVSALVYNIMQTEAYDYNALLSVVETKFNIGYDDIIEKANTLKQFVEKSKKYIDIYKDHITPMSDEELTSGQQVVTESNVDGEEYTSFAQTVAFDNDGKPIYDINKDGFINKEDLELLGANVDNPDDYDFELTKGVWHKRYNVDEIPGKVLRSLKILLYIIEKEDYTETIDFLTLNEKDLLTDTFDLYPSTDEFVKKTDELGSLGYDSTELDNRLLFMRLFVDALSCILRTDKKFILHYVSNMNPKSKAMLTATSGVIIDKIVLGKFVELFMNRFIGNERTENEFIVRGLLNEPLGEYMDYIHPFNLLIKDILETTDLFTLCLDAKTEWLDETLPIINDKINDKYKYK